MTFIKKHKLALAWGFIALCIAIAGKHVADCKGSPDQNCLSYGLYEGNGE